MTAIAPVSNSEIGTFQRCRRLWYLRYVCGYARSEEDEPATGAMQLGTRMHAAFEADDKAAGRLGLAHWVREVYGAEMRRNPDAWDDLRRERDQALVMAQGYVRWAAENGIDEGIEMLAAEQDVVVDMPQMPGVQLRGRLDRMFRRLSDGAVLFRDWKTTGALEDAVRSLRLSPQMPFYVMLQRLASGDVRAEGGQVVFLRRSKQTVRATPPFYAIEEVRYNRHRLNAKFLKVKAELTQMLYARERLRIGTPDAHLSVAPPSPMHDCSWSCPFFFCCDMLDDGSAWREMLDATFMKENPYAYYDRDLLAPS
jgi:RecB family exonuclease